MKKTCVLLFLTILSIGCGYKSKNYNPGMTSGGAPTITSLMPNTAHPGDAPMLTVNGTNFTSTSTIYWGMTPKATGFVMTGQLTTQLTSSDTACSMVPCTVQVYVRTTGGAYGSSGVNSNMLPFTIN
jgi:hypothetical protein